MNHNGEDQKQTNTHNNNNSNEQVYDQQTCDANANKRKVNECVTDMTTNNYAPNKKKRKLNITSLVATHRSLQKENKELKQKRENYKYGFNLYKKEATKWKSEYMKLHSKLFEITNNNTNHFNTTVINLDKITPINETVKDKNESVSNPCNIDLNINHNMNDNYNVTQTTHATLDRELSIDNNDEEIENEMDAITDTISNNESEIKFEDSYYVSVKCHICRIHFDNIQKYRDHFKQHYNNNINGNKEWMQCDWKCQVLFKNTDEFIAHIAKHTKDNPYKCKIQIKDGIQCKASVTYLQTMKLHWKTHFQTESTNKQNESQTEFVNLLKKIVTEIVELIFKRSVSDSNIYQKQFNQIYENVLFTEQCIKRPFCSAPNSSKKAYKTYESFKQDINLMNSENVIEIVQNIENKYKQIMNKLNEDMTKIQNLNVLHEILNTLMDDILKAPTLNILKSLKNIHVNKKYVYSLYQIKQNIHDKNYSKFCDFVNDLRRLYQFCYDLNDSKFKIALNTLPKQFENKLKHEMKELLNGIDFEAHNHFKFKNNTILNKTTLSIAFDENENFKVPTLSIDLLHFNF